MAATEALAAPQIANKRPKKRFDASPLGVTAALTVVAVLIHGYHPYAEDGGVYLPGILKLLHPDLYPTWTGFATAQTRFSLFAPTVAGIVQLTGINLMLSLFCVYVLSIWSTLFAAWQIAARCLKSPEARYGAVAIFALCLTAPAAGTSLLLVDPYVTARSISTPLGLFAIVEALDIISEYRQTSRIRIPPVAFCTISLLIATLMHPLMASYAAGCVVLLLCASISSIALRSAVIGAVAIFAFLVAILVNLLAPAPPAGYAAVALSRYYWFLSAWHWYEIGGLLAPLVVVWAIGRKYRFLNQCGRCLARMAFFAGLISIGVSLFLAHESGHSYSVAMLQPLRVFQTVYIVMILLTGALAAEFLLQRYALRWCALFVVLGALMLFVQIQTFPHSSHIELPWRSPANDWEQGFVWIRSNTPVEATVALDANYIDQPGEDAQNFRAVAERSSIPDYAKDGGIAAIDPALTPEWTAGQMMQNGLASASDRQRRAKLASARANWIVLPAISPTSLDCPYQNRSMKVCRLH